MYLVTYVNTSDVGPSVAGEYDTVEAARAEATNCASANFIDITIWQRHSTAALESRVVFQHHGSGEGRKVGEFNDAP